MSKNTNVKYLIEAAIFAALAMALSFIPDFAGWFSPSYGAIPLVIFSLRRGLKYGLLAGLIWGLLHFALGKVYYLSMSQVFIEYILAFISMGLAGIFSDSLVKTLKEQKKAFCLAYRLNGYYLSRWGTLPLALYCRCYFLGKLCSKRDVCHLVFLYCQWNFWIAYFINHAFGPLAYLANPNSIF
ncbi:thiamine transporter [Streptococcus dysgalactiae subsp. dysgalactiae ATCC 27957]|nr:thiamine transporter [Streptococcus dysgalactiae subsp. dysgalactiae ATCC 27957]